MISKGVVKKIIDDEYAEVEVTRQSACGDNCGTCSGCEKPTYRAISIARNNINAKIGDTVTLRSDTGYVLKGAAFVYVLPVILFFLLYSLAGTFAESESVKVILSGIGFAVGIYIAGMYSKRQNDVKLEIID